MPLSSNPSGSPRAPNNRELLVLFFASFAALTALGLASLATQTVLLFPPLGASAFLVFFTPRAPASSPRNALLAYAIGTACGFFALACTGLWAAPSVLAIGVDFPRVVAASLSIALTSVLMVRLRAVHPPAGATTLVVSLGLVTKASLVGMLFAGTALLLAVAFAVHRALGTPYPFWSAPEGR